MNRKDIKLVLGAIHFKRKLRGGVGTKQRNQKDGRNFNMLLSNSELLLSYLNSVHVIKAKVHRQRLATLKIS